MVTATQETPGAALRRRRQALGMSQVELAGKLGVAPNTVARWERDVMAIQHQVMLDSLLDAWEALRSASAHP